MALPYSLPSKSHEEFFDTAFFANNQNTRLPTPKEVRARADTRHRDDRDAVKFEKLGLFVKWGPHVRIAEGQSLHFLHRRGSRVPEIYGWVRESGVGGAVFLYMQLMQGEVLDNVWESLTATQKRSVTSQLKQIVGSWQSISQPPMALQTTLHVSGPKRLNYLSTVGGESLRDRKFYDNHEPIGPFHNMKAFHDWLASFRTRHRSGDAELAGLNDDRNVIFAHGDLHQENILVARNASGDVDVVAVVDFGQAGWWPEGWEWLKMRTSCMAGDWRDKYISLISQKPDDKYSYSWEACFMAGF